MRFVHIKSMDNKADILTKPLCKESFYRLTKISLFQLPHTGKDNDPDHPNKNVRVRSESKTNINKNVGHVSFDNMKANVAFVIF